MDYGITRWCSGERLKSAPRPNCAPIFAARTRCWTSNLLKNIFGYCLIAFSPATPIRSVTSAVVKPSVMRSRKRQSPRDQRHRRVERRQIVVRGRHPRLLESLTASSVIRQSRSRGCRPRSDSRASASCSDPIHSKANCRSDGVKNRDNSFFRFPGLSRAKLSRFVRSELRPYQRSRVCSGIHVSGNALAPRSGLARRKVSPSGRVRDVRLEKRV